MEVLITPFRIDIHGSVGTTTDYATLIQQQLVDVLMTNFNERVMRPDYGANMQAALFDPSEELVREDASMQVTQRINLWAPRVVLQSVKFSIDELRPGMLWVDVVYQVGAFDEARSLRFPVSTFLSEETPV